MTTHLGAQLTGLLFLVMAFGSVGCASHGDLVKLREELQASVSQVRNDQLQAAETLQHRLKELQTVQQRQQTTLDALQTAVKDFKGQSEILRRTIEELKVKTDIISQDVGRLHGSIRVWNDRFLQSLRTEQEELRNRLKMVDRSLQDLETAGMPNQTNTILSQDRETEKH
jgi:chromosome segregation ATPase